MHGGPSFAPRVPATAAIVVRSKANTTALYAAMLVSAAIVAGLVVAVPLFALWLGATAAPLLALVPLLLAQLWFTVVVVREYRGLLGPQLAADRSGVWVRTGQGARPETVFLPWQAIEGIDTTRKGPVVRIMSRQGEQLFGRRPHWRVRSLRRRFGTAFVVDGRRSAEHPDHIAQRLHHAAGR
jgi:hypothetical protein